MTSGLTSNEQLAFSALQGRRDDAKGLVERATRAVKEAQRVQIMARRTYKQALQAVVKFSDDHDVERLE